MSSELRNDRLLRALRREPVDRTPVWLMRQAGRYLPEYRATRAQAGSFLALAKNPELACEVTLQPLRRFPLDAAILFSDILTIPDAMGLGLYFADGEGPRFERPVRTTADIAKLAVPDMEGGLRYVMDAVRTIRRELDGSVPLIGFSGSPWTLACYMVEGSGSKEWGRVKALALNDPAAMHRLLGVVTDAVIAYLSAQRAARANFHAEPDHAPARAASWYKAIDTPSRATSWSRRGATSTSAAGLPWLTWLVLETRAASPLPVARTAHQSWWPSIDAHPATRQASSNAMQQRPSLWTMPAGWTSGGKAPLNARASGRRSRRAPRPPARRRVRDPCRATSRGRG